MFIMTNSPNVMLGNKKGVFKGWFSLHHVMNAGRCPGNAKSS